MRTIGRESMSTRTNKKDDTKGLTAREKREMAALRGWSRADDKREAYSRWSKHHLRRP